MLHLNLHIGSTRRGWAAALPLLLSGCGGGGDVAPVSAGEPPQAAAAACAENAGAGQLRVDGVCVATFKPFAAAAAGANADADADAGAVAAVDPRALYSWAERAWPQLFSGVPVDGSGTAGSYRFYPGAGHYITVEDSEVRVSGTVTRGAALYAGTLSSLAAVVSASSGKTFTCTDSGSSNCIGFQGSTVGLVGFGGLAASLATDPLDAANPVARLVKSPANETWAGATVRTQAATNTVDTISFATSAIVTLRVLPPAAGQKLMLKVEGSTNGGADLEVQATTTTANAWETLAFDFSKPSLGSFDASRTYTKVSVFPNFGSKVGASTTWHVDELSLRTGAAGTPTSGHTGTCAVTSLVNCQDFEGETLGLTAFGGTSAAYATDPVDAGNRTVKLLKRSSSDVWSGVVLAPGSSTGTVTPVTFGAHRRVTLRVYSPAIGEPLMLKLENSVNGQTVYVAAVASTLGRNAWETLTFDFDQATEGSYDRAAVYDKVVVFPRPGQTVGADTTFYLDELNLKTEDKLTGWNLVWSDEFSGSGLPSAAKWDYDTERNEFGWYNNELQYYARARLENSSVSDGKLSIQAIRENLSASVDDWGPPYQQYTSARLITRGKASWTYGFFEIRAKLPCSLGTWPAIWLLGTGGRWPDDGEIDIMEQRGIASGDKAEVLGTVHNLASVNGQLGGVSQGSETALASACTAFHTYQLNWNAHRIVISVDDANFFTYLNPKTGDLRKWPFDSPQYLLLNVAMGGVLGGTVPAGFSSDKMQVDYVRVYQK